MNNSSSCENPKIERPQAPTLGRVFSIVKEENGSMQSTRQNRARKRPLEKGMCADADVSPQKAAKKENDNDNESSVMTDWEIFQKGREKMRIYRHWLEGKLNTSTHDLQVQKSLRMKEELISSLELRIIELEGASSKNDDAVICETNDDGKLNSTQRLLNIIRSQEAEKEELRVQVSDLESHNASLKKLQKDSSLLAGKCSDGFNSMRSCIEHELSDLKYLVSEQERQIQLLKTEKDSLKQQLHEIEVNQMVEQRKLHQKISELRIKLIDADIEFMNEQNKFTEHLANTPSMIIVESKSPTQFSTESLQIVQEELRNVSASNAILRKHVTQFPKLMQSVVGDTVMKIQEAIRTIDEKNKELVGKYTHEIQLRKCYHNQLVELRGNIRVFCRVRPCIPEDGPNESVMNFDPFDDGVIVVNSKGRCNKFHMDKVFSMNVSQSQVFDEVSSLVRSAIDGFNVCIFAYGQTGSGKTHTMEGIPDDPGVNQRALQLLYEETKTSSWQYDIEASMLEIYNETLRDLLNPDPNTNRLEVKMKQEGGFYVPGLVTVPVSSMHEVNKIIETGHQNRSTASTCMNERSSRSHCLLCVNVTGVNLLTGSKTFGRLNLVDLAGSERVSRSQADGARLKEAQSINKSLSSLGDVINALKNKHSHVPYRNSKLTYLLQESLGGDSKTLMILQVSPGEENASESICTLTFGQRVRSAELGAAKKKIEDGNKGTPTTVRCPTGENTSSPMGATPSKRTPNPSKASPMPAKLGHRLK